MSRDFVSLPSFQGVAANSTATLEIPIGPAYYDLQLTYTTATAGGATLVNMSAELTEIRLKVDGVVQRTFSFAQLNSINTFYGVAFSTGIVPILFSNPWMRTADGEELTRWNTRGLQSFTLEVDIGGATTPTLEARATRAPSLDAMREIIKWRRNTVQVAATGLLTYSGLPKRGAFYALHAFEATAADITDVTVKIDQEEKFKATNAQIAAAYARRGFTMQSGVFTISPFALTERVSDPWPMVKRVGNNSVAVQDFSQDFNMAVAASFTLISEHWGLPD